MKEIIMHWNNRIFEHRNGTEKDEHTFLQPHEVYYNDAGLPSMWSARAVSPRSKEDAERLMRAFDKPAVAWVNENSKSIDEHGCVDYAEWGWLVENGKMEDDDE